MLAAITNRIRSAFSYDALEPRGRRRATGARVYREDFHTRGNRRRRLQENAADLTRNLSLAAWMVRRHLDYVSQFDFHGRNDDENLNRDIERLMKEDSGRLSMDVSGRFSREKFFRVIEARRCLDNDCLVVKLNDGRLQGIQADLIRTPGDREIKGQTWVDGVRLGVGGRPIEYAIHRRTGNTGTEFSRRLQARRVIHYGFFDRFASDQVRGVSPLVSALNPLRDVYENFDYALAKAKVSQLFALAFYRDAEESAGEVSDETEVGEDGSEAGGYKVDFGKGPVVLDMEPGDRAEFLESRQPSSEFQSFTQMVIQVALKALDIPYSFYDESHTNFFGSRGSWMHYERACHDKRADQIEMREEYTRHKTRVWIRDGRLTLPRGMRLSEVKTEWVPRGMPWWDPAKEINGHVQAVKGGLDNPQRVCRATGTDFYDNVDQIAKAQAYAAERGVSLDYAMQQQPREVEVVTQ